jgi:predicted transcriptional regulator
MLCLNALWSLGEANVADVRRTIGGSRPLAYTTVMTLLERLAKKGAVSRRKVGRAFYYAPAVSQQSLRTAALRQFVDCFFDGSVQNLSEFIRESDAVPGTPVNGNAPAEESLDASLL